MKVILGIDDTSKAPVIGSIFIVGVLGTPVISRELKRIGVKDSKLLSSMKRKILLPKISKVILNYEWVELTPKEIDDKRLNLNDWEMLKVQNLIAKFLPPKAFNNPQEVLIDNWEINEEHFRVRWLKIESQSELKSISPSIFIKPEHNADVKYPLVSAASIIAKEMSERQLFEYRAKYGDFGSAHPNDKKTEEFIRKHPNCPIIRKSWKTYKRVLDISGKVL